MQLFDHHLRRAAIVAAVVASAGCSKGGGDADTAEPKPVVGANTIVIAPRAFTETLGAIGNVVGRSGHVATLSAPQQARVAEVLVTTGQTVQQGQELIRLEQAPFLAAEQSAAAALQAAQRNNERQQRLANEGIVPRKDAEQAAADEAKAQSDEVAARRMAELAVLRSPIAGVVTKLAASIGASADPSQPLVEVSDPSALDVLMNVTPTDAAKVHAGVKVSLSAGQSASGEALGIGSVVDVSGTIDSTTRGVAVRVQAPTTRRPLRIGETIFGQIALYTSPAAIVIPADALVPSGADFTVFVVDPNGIAHERDVKVGGKTDSTVEITDGLRAGERIVTTGAYAVQDSAKVVPLKPAAAPTATAPEKP
ncbi:MAG TPA: efflux RND transporter periplasmic adaptor subunit [Gemmatimonadaceae bacterium]